MMAPPRANNATSNSTIHNTTGSIRPPGTQLGVTTKRWTVLSWLRITREMRRRHLYCVNPEAVSASTVRFLMVLVGLVLVGLVFCHVAHGRRAIGGLTDLTQADRHIVSGLLTPQVDDVAVDQLWGASPFCEGGVKPCSSVWPSAGLGRVGSPGRP